MTQTQLTTDEVIDVPKRDEQGSKYNLTACRVRDIEETPSTRFRHLQYPFWVPNAKLLVEYNSAGFVPQCLLHVTMLGKGGIFYGETDVVYRIGRDIQRLWFVEKQKDPKTVPFYHAGLPVYSWMSGPVSTNMYQFDKHSVWTETTTRCDNKVYPLLSLFLTPLSARALAHCSTSYLSFLSSNLQLPNYLTYSARHAEGL